MPGSRVDVRRWTAFEGDRRLVAGRPDRVARAAKAAFDRGGRVLVVDDRAGSVIDVDYWGRAADVLARRAVRTSSARPTEPAEPRGPGRPRLGVVAREVTLLPRHWTWLSSQPGGASVALRRLVDGARRTRAGTDRVRHAQEVAFRAMTALAGDRPGFEEALRALFAADSEGFDRRIADWPSDIRQYVASLAEEAFRGSR